MYILLILCALLCIQETAHATDISKNILSNTTWTITNSPYIIKNDIYIADGCLLTIEPGVVVLSDTYFMPGIHGGAINVVGNTSSTVSIANVLFDCTSLSFESSNFQYDFSSYYTYRIAQIIADTVQFKNCTILNTNESNIDEVISIISDSLLITGSKFILSSSNSDKPHLIQTNSLSIKSSQLENVSIQCQSLTDLSDNILGENLFFTSGSCVGVNIARNIFYGHNFWQLQTSNCTFINNNIIYDDFNIDGTSTYLYNTFHSENNNCHVIAPTNNRSIPNNYWSTTSIDEIDEMIIDKFENIYLGILSYLPILTEAHQSTPKPTLVYGNPPVANAGGDKICAWNYFEFDASSSVDLDNDIISYQWTIDLPFTNYHLEFSGKKVTLRNIPYGIHDVILKVIDSKGNTSMDYMKLYCAAEKRKSVTIPLFE